MMSEHDARCYCCREAAGRKGLVLIAHRLFCEAVVCQGAGRELHKAEQARDLIDKSVTLATAKAVEPFDRRSSRPPPAPVAPARPGLSPMEIPKASRFDPRQSQRPAPAPAPPLLPPTPLDPRGSLRRAG